MVAETIYMAWNSILCHPYSVDCHCSLTLIGGANVVQFTKIKKHNSMNYSELRWFNRDSVGIIICSHISMLWKDPQ